ncbi:hypothetical protein ACWC2K_28795 [Streptomyces chattanoogensis]
MAQQNPSLAAGTPELVVRRELGHRMEPPADHLEGRMRDRSGGA